MHHRVSERPHQVPYPAWLSAWRVEQLRIAVSHQSSERWKDPDEMHHKSFPVFGLAGEDYLWRKGVLEH